MQVSQSVDIDIECRPEEAYDFVTSLESPAKTFSGYGPIPAVLETTIDGDGPLREGTILRARSSDGSVMKRTITILDRARRHEYVIDGNGFRPLFRRMVRRGTGIWLFEARGDKTRLTWTYRFDLRSIFWWLAVVLLVRIFFGAAMRRCVLATKRELEQTSSSTELLPRVATG